MNTSIPYLEMHAVLLQKFVQFLALDDIQDDH